MKRNQRTSRTSSKEFWNLWKTASDALVGNAVAQILKQAEEHEIRCAILDGMRKEEIPTSLIEQRTLVTVIRHLENRCGENFEIVASRDLIIDRPVRQIELRIHAKPVR